jgi:mono/diheme cytochrome c family protein
MKLALSLLLLASFSMADNAQKLTGKKVFETYCWGCHHQTAMAFGPSFTQIASMRNSDEIRAMITDPKAVSKVLGYKRNAMPAFKLTDKELTLITDYILSYKSDESIKPNRSIVEDAYPNIATNKETK